MIGDISKHVVNGLANDSVENVSFHNSSNGGDWIHDGGPLPYSTCEKIMIGVVMGLLSFLSTFGNIMVFIAYFKVKSLQHATNYFILSLATADVVVAVLVVNVHTMYMLIGWPYHVFSYAVCLAWLSIDYWLFQVSVFGVLLLTCDRYLSIKYPIRYRIRRTDKAVKIVIAINWIASFFIWVPVILFYGIRHNEEMHIRRSKCDVASDKVVPATVIGCLVSYFLPVIIILYIVMDSTRVLIKCRHYIKPPTRRRKVGVGTATVTPGLKASTNKGFVSDGHGISSSYSSEHSNDLTTIPDDDLNKSSKQATFNVHFNGDFASDHKTDNPYKCPEHHYGAVYLTPNSNLSTLSSPTTHAVKRTSFDANLRKLSNSIHITKSPTSSIKRTSIDGNMPEPSNDIYVIKCSTSSIKKTSFDRNLSMKKSSIDGVNDASKRRHSRLSFVQDLDKNQWMAAFNVMLGVSFFINVLPFGVLAIYRSSCNDEEEPCVSQQLWYFGYIMAYLNSMLNPLCYALGNNNFKRAFKAIICGKE